MGGMTVFPRGFKIRKGDKIIKQHKSHGFGEIIVFMMRVYKNLEAVEIFMTF
jgi:hypothetical protein